MSKNRLRLSYRAKEQIRGYLFLLPWLIGLVTVFALPLVRSVVFAFSELNFASGGEIGYTLTFVGIENFQKALLEDIDFPKYLVSTLGELVYNVPIILVFSFFVALLLKKRTRGTNVVKAIYFLPVILSSGIFLSLQSNFGDASASALEQTMEGASASIAVLKSINMEKYLLEIGIPADYIGYLTAPIDRLYSTILSSGVQIFIFLAGLNAISPSLYEAANVEGGNAWENFWNITFPMTMPMLLVNLVFSVIDSFTSVNNAVMNYVYELAFTHLNFGMSNAMSWLYFFLLLVIMGTVTALVSRKIFYYT